MACNTYQSTHFYYKNNNENSCDRIGDDSVLTDSTAWPSSYYGRTKRIDLAKVYSDTLLRINQEQEQERKSHQRNNKKGRRQVSFTTAPPIIHEYEREDIHDYCRDRKRYDDAGHLRIQTLDLRPIPNNCYNKQQRHHRHQRSVSSPPTSPLVSPNYSLASPISSSSSSSSPTKSLSASIINKTSMSTTSIDNTTKKPSKKSRVDYDKQTFTDGEDNNISLLLLKQPIRTRSFNFSTFINFKSFKMK